MLQHIALELGHSREYAQTSGGGPCRCGHFQYRRNDPHCTDQHTGWTAQTVRHHRTGCGLSEPSLSLLDVRMRPPAISWGVLLQEAQTLTALAPWLLVPGLAVVLAVLAFSFMGDGVRDAADPYAR